MTAQYEDNYGSGWQDPGYSGGGVRHSFLRKLTPVVKVLLILNVVIFLLQAIFTYQVNRPLEFYLAVVPEHVVGKFWIWQLLTYMFLHAPLPALGHIFINMLILYFFGPELEMRLGPRRFLTLYLGAGILAGILFVFFHFLDQPRTPMLGASGALMGITVLFACYWPNRTVLLFFVIPVKIKFVVIAFIFYDLFSFVVVRGDGIAHSAHLGGALFGYLYFRYEGAFFRWLERREQKADFKDYKQSSENKMKVDELLAKISKSGLNSLSGKERRFLKQMSRKYKDKF